MTLSGLIAPDRLHRFARRRACVASSPHPALWCDGAQSTLELLRLAFAAAGCRLADSDAVALAASDPAAATADAQRRAAPDDTLAAEATQAAVSALEVAECNCEAAAHELEAAEAAADARESYEGVLGYGDDADDASQDEPAPAAGTAAPSPPPVYGVHLSPLKMIEQKHHGLSGGLAPPSACVIIVTRPNK